MLYRKFSWLYRCANWRCRDFFAAENIKDIKSFCAKKIGFNISGNYLGGFLIANCAGKQCTARCSQRVAQRFADVCTLWSSYQWANISAEPHVASNVRYIAFSMRTNTLFALCLCREYRDYGIQLFLGRGLKITLGAFPQPLLIPTYSRFPNS